MSVAEYRAWVEDRPNNERWEVLDGEPVLMSPPGARHQRIVANLARKLGDLAERRGGDALPGLRSFLIVHQDQARVEVWTRGDGWSMRGLGPGDLIDRPELGGTLAVSDVYARVVF